MTAFLLYVAVVNGVAATLMSLMLIFGEKSDSYARAGLLFGSTLFGVASGAAIHALVTGVP